MNEGATQETQVMMHNRNDDEKVGCGKMVSIYVLQRQRQALVEPSSLIAQLKLPEAWFCPKLGASRNKQTHYESVAQYGAFTGKRFMSMNLSLESLSRDSLSKIDVDCQPSKVVVIPCSRPLI
jgi:hypothetical protein